MTKLHAIAKGLGATLLLASASTAFAETVNVPATLTVDNTIDFTTTGTLDFGTVRATPDNSAAVNCVGLTMPANPALALNSTLGTAGAAACTATGTAVLQAVGGTPTRPEFSIAGVAAFTTLTLTLPTTVDLTTTAPAGSPIFRLVDFTAYRTSGTPAAVTTTVQVDGSGNATFNVGATLLTDPGMPTTSAYENAAYTGNFDVQVAF